MRKRLKNVYQCLVAGCSEHGLVKTVTIDANEHHLFVQPTYLCQCGWEPTLLDSTMVSVKYEHPVAYEAPSMASSS